MKKIEIQTSFKKLLADVYTPVGIYLRLRDRFRDTILLESTDFHAGENSYSFIGINAVAGIEISNPSAIEFKLPGHTAEKIKINNPVDVSQLLWDFMQRFEIKEAAVKPVHVAQGLFGYTTYDAVQFFDSISFNTKKYPSPAETNEQRTTNNDIPLMRYRLYQYIIAINHFKDELFICENHFLGIESEVAMVESLIKSKDVPGFPFKSRGEEKSNITDAEYIDMVNLSLIHI